MRRTCRTCAHWEPNLYHRGPADLPSLCANLFHDMELRGPDDRCRDWSPREKEGHRRTSRRPSPMSEHDQIRDAVEGRR